MSGIGDVLTRQLPMVRLLPPAAYHRLQRLHSPIPCPIRASRK